MSKSKTKTSSKPVEEKPKTAEKPKEVSPTQSQTMIAILGTLRQLVEAVTRLEGAVYSRPMNVQWNLPAVYPGGPFGPEIYAGKTVVPGAGAAAPGAIAAPDLRPQTTCGGAAEGVLRQEQPSKVAHVPSCTTAVATQMQPSTFEKPATAPRKKKVEVSIAPPNPHTITETAQPIKVEPPSDDPFGLGL